MLIILAVFPGAAPFKALFGKQPEAKIVFIDLKGKIRRPVNIGLTARRLHRPFSVNGLYIRIIQRIYIHREAETVLRYLGGMGNEAEIKGGGIVVLHRSLVVRAVLVYQPDPFDGVIRFVKLFQDIQNILRDMYVYDHFALMLISVQVLMKNVQVSEILPGKGAVLLKGQPVYPFKDLIGDGGYIERIAPRACILFIQREQPLLISIILHHRKLHMMIAVSGIGSAVRACGIHFFIRIFRKTHLLCPQFFKLIHCALAVLRRYRTVMLRMGKPDRYPLHFIKVLHSLRRIIKSRTEGKYSRDGIRIKLCKLY